MKYEIICHIICIVEQWLNTVLPLWWKHHLKPQCHLKLYLSGSHICVVRRGDVKWLKYIWIDLRKCHKWSIFQCLQQILHLNTCKPDSLILCSLVFLSTKYNFSQLLIMHLARYSVGSTTAFYHCPTVIQKFLTKNFYLLTQSFQKFVQRKISISEIEHSSLNVTQIEHYTKTLCTANISPQQTCGHYWITEHQKSSLRYYLLKLR